MRIFYLLLLVFFSGYSYGQLINNGSFEQWDSSGSPPPFNWLEPSSWSSTNPITEFSMAGIGRSSTALSGSYSVQVLTTNVQTASMEYQPSILALGNAHIFMLWATNRIAIDETSGGVPVTGTINGMTGYFQFSSSSLGDSAEIRVYVKKSNGPGQVPDIVKRGTVKLGPANSWTAFQVSLDSVGPGPGDTVSVFVYSTKPSDPMQGGVLLLDSLSFTDVSTSIRPLGQIHAQIYPNPAKEKLFFTLYGISQSTVRLVDMNGQVVKLSHVDGARGELEVSDLASGIYLLEVSSPDGTLRERIRVQK